MGPKRNLHLDLNATGAGGKRSRNATVLTSPDVQRLKLNSPQLREFLTTNLPASGATPTPSASGYAFPAPTEQELYVKEFEKAPESTRPAMTFGGAVLMGGSSATSSLPSTLSEVSSRPSSSASGESDIKQEIEEAPTKGRRGGRSRKSTSSSETITPIDMDCQEKIKLDRKRQRNRLAATKCRKKKLEKIAKLEDRVKDLKTENTELGSVLKRLKENVCNLKQEVMEHVNNGCQIDVTTSAS